MRRRGSFHEESVELFRPFGVHSRQELARRQPSPASLIEGMGCARKDARGRMRDTQQVVIISVGDATIETHGVQGWAMERMMIETAFRVDKDDAASSSSDITVTLRFLLMHAANSMFAAFLDSSARLIGDYNALFNRRAVLLHTKINLLPLSSKSVVMGV